MSEDNLFDPGEPLESNARRAQLDEVRRVADLLAPLGAVERISKPTGSPLPWRFVDEVQSCSGMTGKWPELWLRRPEGLDLLVRCCARSDKNRSKAIDMWMIEPDSWRFLEAVDRCARRSLPAVVVFTFDEKGEPEPTCVELAGVGAMEHGLGRGRYATHSKTDERFAFAPSGRRPLSEYLASDT